MLLVNKNLFSLIGEGRAREGNGLGLEGGVLLGLA